MGKDTGTGTGDLAQSQPRTHTMAATAGSLHAGGDGASESNSSAPADKFGHLLRFSEEITPVFEGLTEEQRERRKVRELFAHANIIFVFIFPL